MEEADRKYNSAQKVLDRMIPGGSDIRDLVTKEDRAPEAGTRMMTSPPPLIVGATSRDRRGQRLRFLRHGGP